MSADLFSLAEQRMDIATKEWVLCKCNYSIVYSASKYCMICEVPFADSWKFHKEFFEEKAKVEKTAIEAHEEGEEEVEESDDEVLTFPPKISISLKKIYNDHLKEAHDKYAEAWKTHVKDKLGFESLESTMELFSGYYNDHGTTKAKGRLLDKIRNAKDGETKIAEFAEILEAAKNA